MLNVDRWTDRRTNGRTLACLCLPAKAGATKRTVILESIVTKSCMNFVWTIVPISDTGCLQSTQFKAENKVNKIKQYTYPSVLNNFGLAAFLGE